MFIEASLKYVFESIHLKRFFNKFKNYEMK